MDKRIPKIRAPKGYSFSITKEEDGDVVITLHHQGRSVGWIDLRYEGRHTYRTHSELYEAYHDQGLGTRMYARAIQYALEHGYSIRSSGSSSDMAKRVWNGNGLRKYFTIKKKTILGAFHPNIWYAYPKGK